MADIFLLAFIGAGIKFLIQNLQPSIKCTFLEPDSAHTHIKWEKLQLATYRNCLFLMKGDSLIRHWLVVLQEH